MELIFMGTPSFAVPILSSLIKSRHNVVAVVTQPDRPKGRSSKLVQSPVKVLAAENNLVIFQPENINKDDRVISSLKNSRADLVITAAFGQIVSRQILSIPKKECINIHTSLLPKYRGAAPINRAIINGESETGVSIINMTEALDAGDIVASDTTRISPDENAEELEERLAGIAVELLQKVIASFEKNSVKYKCQDEGLVTYASKLEKGEGAINWNGSSESIHNLIRGLIPWPCAYSFLQKRESNTKKRIIIKKSCLKCEDEIIVNKQPGTINKTGEKGMLVSTCNGGLWINVLQPEGKRAMDAKDFINGYNIEVGDTFTIKT